MNDRIKIAVLDMKKRCTEKRVLIERLRDDIKSSLLRSQIEVQGHELVLQLHDSVLKCSVKIETDLKKETITSIEDCYYDEMAVKFSIHKKDEIFTVRVDNQFRFQKRRVQTQTYSAICDDTLIGQYVPPLHLKDFFFGDEMGVSEGQIMRMLNSYCVHFSTEIAGSRTYGIMNTLYSTKYNTPEKQIFIETFSTDGSEGKLSLDTFDDESRWFNLILGGFSEEVLTGVLRNINYVQERCISSASMEYVKRITK